LKYDGKINDYLSGSSLYMFHELKHQRNCNISLCNENKWFHSFEGKLLREIKTFAKQRSGIDTGHIYLRNRFFSRPLGITDEKHVHAQGNKFDLLQQQKNKNKQKQKHKT